MEVELDPDTVATLDQLVGQLNALRTATGKSYRDIEKYDGSSSLLARTSVQEMLRGSRPPTRERVLAFAQACGEPPDRVASWAQAFDRATAPIGADTATTTDADHPASRPQPPATDHVAVPTGRPDRADIRRRRRSMLVLVVIIGTAPVAAGVLVVGWPSQKTTPNHVAQAPTPAPIIDAVSTPSTPQMAPSNPTRPATPNTHTPSIRPATSPAGNPPPATIASPSPGPATIAVSPNHGGPTDIFTVRGTGWLDTTPCGGQVNIYVDDRIISHYPGYPGADGRFVTDYHPDDAGPAGGPLSPGTHRVAGRCNSYESPAAIYTVN